MRKLTKIGAVVIAVIMLAGCSTSNKSTDSNTSGTTEQADTGSETEEAETSGEKVKITYSAWGGAEEKATEEAIAKAFMEANPDIEVELIFPEGSYEQKLQILIAGGEAPDVISIGSAHIPNFSTAFKPLDEALGADANYISDSVKEALVYDGAQYALPKRANTKAFAYNIDLLEKAGVAIPTEDYSIEQFSEDAKKIAALGDDIYGVVSLPFSQWLSQFGGKMMDDDGQILFNSEEGVAAAQFIADAINVYKFAPSTAVIDGQDVMQWFVTGTAGFKGDLGPFNLPTLSEITTFDWDICAAPGQGGRIEIVGVAMSATTEYSEAAQKLIEFISTSKAAQEIIGSTTAMPVTEEGKVVFLNQYPEKNLQIFFDAIDYQEAPVQIKGSNLIGDIVNPALNDRTAVGIVGTEDIATVLDEAAEEAQAAIDELR